MKTTQLCPSNDGTTNFFSPVNLEALETYQRIYPRLTEIPRQPLLRVSPKTIETCQQIYPSVANACQRFDPHAIEAIQNVAQAYRQLPRMNPYAEYTFQRFSKMSTEVSPSELLQSRLPDFHSTYPDFQCWLGGKVFPEARQNSLRREVIFISTPNSTTAGFAILKNTAIEKKICTFYIAPPFRHLDYGSRLMEECFKYLGTNTPLLTMPDTCKDSFIGLLKRYKFQFIHELPDYYVEGSTEYVFNGVLR